MAYSQSGTYPEQAGFNLLNDKLFEPATLRRFYIALILALGVLQAYTSRYQMGVDAVGYLDVANGYLNRQWDVAINGYWSPLYSWLLALAFAIFKPAYSSEFPLLHGVNLLGFLFTVFCFHRFWSTLTADQTCNGETQSVAAVMPRLWDLYGYLLFLSMFCPLVAAPTPDLTASGFVFLICGECLEWKQRGEIRPWAAAKLGLFIALAFFAKTILLYFGLAALGSLIFDSRLRARRQIIWAVIALGMLISPWVWCLHHRYAEYSLGYSGKLNYAWFVNGCPTGQLMEPGSAPYVGLPAFPGPKLQETPAVFKVESRKGVSFNLWFDPESFSPRKPYFNLRQQLHAVGLNLQWLREWFTITYAAAFLVPLVLLFAGPVSVRRAASYRHMFLPSLALILLYALIFVRTYRYVAAVALVLFAVGTASSSVGQENRKFAGRTFCLLLLLFAMNHVPSTIGLAVRGDTAGKRVVDAVAAFNKMGVESDSRVGGIGATPYIYWSRLTKHPISAIMWDHEAAEYWNSCSETKLATLCAMKNAGVTLAIGEPPLRQEALAAGWLPLGQSGYWLKNIGPSSGLRCER